MSTSTPPPDSTAPSAGTDTSYSMLDRGDVEAIGAHCSYEYCHQLDFLPFKCQSCGENYCLDHRTETAHQCSNPGAWARTRREASASASASNTSLPTATKPTLLTSQQCSSPVCKTFINTTQNLGVHCQTCNRTYCLKHRFPEDHSCKTLTPLGARPSPATTLLDTNREKLRLGFSRLKASWTSSNTPGSTTNTTKKSSPTTTTKQNPTKKSTPLTSLNTLKQTATGDPKTPLPNRIYLHVSCTDKLTKDNLPKSAAMYFDSNWKIGKILDLVATKLNVENLNHVASEGEKRLFVYHVEGGGVLGFGDVVGKFVKSGQSLVLVRGLDV